MEENIELLKYIYQEDIYIIEDPSSMKETQALENDKTETLQTEMPQPHVEETNPVTFFGSNEKGILILTNDPENEFLNQSDLDFLMKIVESGLRFSKHDFALVNTARHSAQQALDEIPYSYLLSFDIGNSHDNDQLYLVKEENGKKILLAESLKEIAADTSKKTALWKNLKIMFNI